jgi:hypothetical protein
MGLRFFHRVPIVGRFVTLNLSKGGASVSVGVPGAHVTAGTHGTRVTVGVPGTGLFYTEQLTRQPSPADGRVRQLVDAYRTCAVAREAATADDYLRAIHLQQELGLRDDELPAEMLAARGEILSLLQERFGYRIVHNVTPPAPPPPQRRWRTIATIGIVAFALLLLLFLIWQIPS